MRWKFVVVLFAACMAVPGTVDRATAFGVPDAAAVAGTASVAGGLAPLLRVSGGCGWKHNCYITPQYFRYPPPSLTIRCFNSRWGDLHCPYSVRPAWWRGCWMDHTGRMVCQKGGHHW